MIRLFIRFGLKLTLLVSFVTQANDVTLIKNARLLVSDLQSAETTDVLIEKGRISAIGSDLKHETAEVIDAQNGVLSAGFFNAFTELGVREVGSVKDTVDSASENARITASLRVSDAINPHSVLLPYNRSHGLTHALVVPAAKAGLFAGTAALIRLSEQDTVVEDQVALVVGFNNAALTSAGGSRAALFAQLREAFEDARDYRANRSSYNSGNRRDYALSRHDLEAIWPVIQRKIPLLVALDKASDIEKMLAFAKAQNIKLILAGVQEGWRVAEQIAAAKVPVILDPIHNLPSSYATLAARLDNAALLNQAGVSMAFTGMGWHQTHNAYLVRQSAGNAIANGLPYSAALKAVTTNPAKIFGLDDGNLSVKDEANLVLWDGDPFEPQTSVLALWLAGEKQSLQNRSTRLRDRYFEKIKAQKALNK